MLVTFEKRACLKFGSINDNKWNCSYLLDGLSRRNFRGITEGRTGRHEYGPHSQIFELLAGGLRIQERLVPVSKKSHVGAKEQRRNLRVIRNGIQSRSSWSGCHDSMNVRLRQETEMCETYNQCYEYNSKCYGYERLAFL